MDEITSGMTAEETIPSPEESGEGNSFSEEVTSEETFESAESEEAPIEPDAPDYAAIVEADVKELRESFPELRTIKDVTELKNPVRFAALRDLGLTATEAYLAAKAEATRIFDAAMGVLIDGAPAISGSVTAAASRTQLYVGLQFCSSLRVLRLCW